MLPMLNVLPRGILEAQSRLFPVPAKKNNTTPVKIETTKTNDEQKEPSRTFKP